MKIYTLLLVLGMSFSVFSQRTELPYGYNENSPEWVKYMYSDVISLFTLRELYDSYYNKYKFVKNQHTQYYKRLMKENWLNVDHEGHILPVSKKSYSAVTKSATSPWQEVGPWDYDHEQAMTFEVQSPGSAHVYTIEQSLLNPNLVFAGTATAGLWKSIDKGLNWQLMTRDLNVNAVYSIALDPLNTDVVYFGEEGGQIWKSIDGGINWFLTGSASFQSQTYNVRDLKIIGNDVLLVATNRGLYRSTNGGVDWTIVQTGEHMEIEIKPDNFSVLFAVKLVGNKTEFYKSLDNGISWTLKSNGWPLPSAGQDQSRTEISVTPADPNIVYAWSGGDANSNDGGLYGIYKSTDAGESFVFQCCGSGPGGVPSLSNPNLLGWSEDGAETGGQYTYDLSVAASPTNALKVFGSGINVWRSENGGVSWTLNSHWVTWVANLKHRYNHADVHDIKFFYNGSGYDMWIASDGGAYYSSDQGDNVEPRMHGIHGTDFWGFQAGFKNGNVMVGGTYHNGTHIRYNDIYKGGITDPNSGGWLGELGGDNFRGFVNYGNNKIGYSDNGSFLFSETREERITSRSFNTDYLCNTSYVWGEYGNYGFSPHNYNTFYSPVGNKLYLTRNGGISFDLVYSFGGGNVIQVKVPWKDTNTIYVTHKQSGSNYRLKKSNDGGQTWIDITPSNTVTGNNAYKPKYFEVDDENPQKVWLILMGSHSGNKVFETTDGGTTWQNLTTSTIANENVISISHHYGSDDGLYIGTSKRIYYLSDNLGDWALFNNSLPASTTCAFLEPYYGEGKIRTASQRGVYECEFYEDSPPVAMVSANTNSLNIASNCSPDSIQFMDHSTVRRNTATWSWIFEGGTPAFSSAENPVVYYDTPGTYDVKLVVTDTYGEDSVTLTDFVTVTNLFHHPWIEEDFNGTAFPPSGWKLEDSQGSSWEHDWPEGDDTDKVASYPNYWVDATNQSHLLILPALDLTNALWTNLYFDVAYNNNGNYNDSLAVLYRTGGQNEWQTIWKSGGSELTSPSTDVWFWYDQNPTIQYANKYVDFSFLLGESCVEIAFSNEGRYGNHIWIDNVNLFGQYVGLDKEKRSMISVFPNPTTGLFNVLSSDEIVSYTICDVSGKLISSTTILSNHFNVDLSSQQNGIYLLELNTTAGKRIIRIIKN